ncbi:unnamed protein product [Knipowitschia caucasica]
MSLVSLAVLLCLSVGAVSARENLALGGNATQIDTYNELGAASNAIDGKRESIYYLNSCTHTYTTSDPWWRVDLGEACWVTSISVTNRGDCCAERLDGAQIRVGNSLDNNGNSNHLVATIISIAQGQTENFSFTEPVQGRYVNVFLPGTNKYLTLCEVEVYGNKGEDPGQANLALNGQATQIDTYNELGAASNAIDGKRESIYSMNSCTHTYTTSDPWWRVDLGEACWVTSISVTNRGDCCAERLDGAQIRVGNSLDNNGNSNHLVQTIAHIPGGTTQTYSLPNPVEGRYVNVFLPGTNKYLTLCEVEVYGIQPEGAPLETK